jgi:hypothetical protein
MNTYIVLLQFNVGNFTVQNHDDGWVTLTDQRPTAIVVLNGKISSIELEQIWLWKLFLKN